ncbi:MAG: peptidase T [Bacteroidales bacterium]|nr:peptidase T [Bacteroidales bacterium]
MELTDRFIRYVQVETTSDETTEVTPSTPTQMIFAQQLKAELDSLGFADVVLDELGYLYATLPASPGMEQVPVIGFIAHMDTAPDASGKNVKPRIIEHYDGKDIQLNADTVMQTSYYPELLNHVGEDLIVTDGTTLLGADDKAGIAEIITAMTYLMQHPEIKHGKVRIAFNPDEEIGMGAHHFDVKLFGCDWAYTMDGGEVGELEFENFNAASAKITFHGTNVHPGTAKDKMINAALLAMEFAEQLPDDERPEHTEGYEGFYHLTSMSGTVESAQLSYIIRDHNRELFEARKQNILAIADNINSTHPGACEVALKDQYYNMLEKVQEADEENKKKNLPGIIELAKQAILEAGVAPKVQPIRGGTDGAQLSFKGLPCPNIFAGGMNMHGRFEYVPIQSMEKAMMTVVNICKNIAK